LGIGGWGVWGVGVWGGPPRRRAQPPPPTPQKKKIKFIKKKIKNIYNLKIKKYFKN